MSTPSSTPSTNRQPKDEITICYTAEETVEHIPTSVEVAKKNNVDISPNHRHFADVVRVVMVARSWLLSVRDEEERAAQAERQRVHNANVAMVFDLPSQSAQQQTHGLSRSHLSSCYRLIADSQVHGTTTDQPNGTNSSSMQNGRSQNHSTYNNSKLPPLLPPPLKRTFKEKLQNFWTKLKGAPFESVDPAKPIYYYWTLIVYIGFLYNSLMCVIFVFDDTQGLFFTFWFFGNTFFDAIYLMDIFVNSKLNHMEDGVTVRVADSHWISRVFYPQIFLLILNRNYSLVRINRLLKFYRVSLNIITFIGVLDFVERTNIRTNYPNGFRIFHIVVTCAVIFHLNAALYFKISLIRGINSTEFMAWEFNYVKNTDPVFADCDILLTDSDERCGLDESNLDVENRTGYLNKLIDYWDKRASIMKFSNFTKQYSLSIYWSSLTLTTSGQQPYPTEDLHNYLEILDTIVGVLVFAVIVGSVYNVVVHMNMGRAQVQQLMDGIKFYMHYRNVSPDIQKRVLDCIGYISKYGMIRDEKEIMKAVPPRLQGELALHVHMETLKNVELLADCEPSIFYELVLRLTMHMYTPRDYICRYGDVAKEMYIIRYGTLEILNEHGVKVNELHEGSTFGELSLLRVSNNSKANRRMWSLRSVGYSDVYQLKQEDMLEVMSDYPEAKHRLSRKVREISRRRNQENIERDEVEEGQMVHGFHSVDETLTLLTASIKDIGQELDELYTYFQKQTSENKRRVTRLETIYRKHRTSRPSIHTFSLSRDKNLF
ncbi:CGMP-gated cation channel alpha-1 [Aphelenchoides besseyi]|nr:CGMP-gated cation channel alpha-1 [Aphelenchoides besseyi]